MRGFTHRDWNGTRFVWIVDEDRSDGTATEEKALDVLDGAVVNEKSNAFQLESLLIVLHNNNVVESSGQVWED
jgi:hypothetical protein